MSVGDQTQRAKDLQHCHLCLDVLGAQTLGDGVDALGVGQHMGTALRIVHQGLNAANDRCVDPTLRRLVVHAVQEVKEAGEAVQLDEARDKPGDMGQDGGDDEE